MPNFSPSNGKFFSFVSMALELDLAVISSSQESLLYFAIIWAMLGLSTMRKVMEIASSHSRFASMCLRIRMSPIRTIERGTSWLGKISPCHLLCYGWEAKRVVTNHFGVGLNQLDDPTVRGKDGGKQFLNIHCSSSCNFHFHSKSMSFPSNVCIT